MASSVVLVRTNKLDENTRKITKLVCPYFQSNVYIVLEDYSNKNLTIELKGNVITLGGKFLEESKLQYFPKVGWQCGDYILYGASKVLNYDYFWLVEPDLRFTLDVNELFSKLEKNDHDLIGIHFGYREPNWSWYPSMTDLYKDKISGLYFPFLRISKNAVDFCLQKRIEYKNIPSIKSLNFEGTGMIKEYANDEAFIATTLRNNRFSCISMNKLTDDELKEYFSTELPILEDELGQAYLQGKIIHPVLSDPHRTRIKFKNFLRSRNSPKKLEKRMCEIINSLGAATWIKYSEIEPHIIRDRCMSDNIESSQSEASNELFDYLIKSLDQKKLGSLGYNINPINILNIDFKKIKTIFKVKVSHGFVAIDIDCYDADRINILKKNYLSDSLKSERIYKTPYHNEFSIIKDFISGEFFKLNNIITAIRKVSYQIIDNKLKRITPVNTYWWNGVPNFGDWVGPWLINKIKKYPVTNVIGTEASNVIYGVGSVLQMIESHHKNISIWGSGLMSPEGVSQFLTRTDNGKNVKCISAVRGLRTYEALVKNEVSCNKVFGDPALLMPLLYNPSFQVKDISVVPHWKHSELFKNIDHDRIEVVDVKKELTNVIDSIANSKYCFSTSLHGIIIAQAYGVPWVWLDIKDFIMHGGDGFKFYDFLSVFEEQSITNKFDLLSNQITNELFVNNTSKAKIFKNIKHYSANALIDALDMCL